MAFLKIALMGVTLSVVASTAFSQKVSVKATATADTTTNKPATTQPKSGPKPYNEVITAKAVTRKGLITVHKIEDKYYFEIPTSLLKKEILLVSRIAKSSIEVPKTFSGYAGDQINKAVITFEQGPNNKIFIRKQSFQVNPDSSKPMYQNVLNSNIQPIALAYDVKSIAPDSLGKGLVIDVTESILADNDIFGFSAFAKSAFQVGSVQSDKSFVNTINTYPTNVEIKTVKTFAKNVTNSGMPTNIPPNPALTAALNQGSITLEINNSMIVLPEKKMQPRYEDSRVGYFSSEYTDYDANPQGIKTISMISRWRLEPKPEDMQKYLNGELVEPQKPIVFYIDPTTPKKWIPYLIQGVNDWQVAFERAGFKNAIIGKEAPTKEQDSTWSLDDARHSAIVYKPSPVENASGPSNVDPRTGEILESHINWYHNVMRLLRDWYFIQASPSDARARKMVFDDELMGQLIRFVSSHEVGHTLGLPHNFGSSSTVPVENLRNKAWVEANGHTPSIMDYARFNYVAQPEDGISEMGLFPRIGEYDKWAIEWGYKLIPQAKSAADEVPILDKWIDEKSTSKVYYYGRQGQPDDPRDQSECLGDNNMKASEYGLKNLKRIVPNLISWTKMPNEEYESLFELYNEVVGQYRRYIGHVVYNIGGIYETLKKTNQPGNVYEFVSKSTQQEAMSFLQKNVFATPQWLIDKNIAAKINIDVPNIILQSQEIAFGRVLNNYTLVKLLKAELDLGDKAYTVANALDDLKQGIFTELSTKAPIDMYRRNLQKAYVQRIVSLLNSFDGQATTGTTNLVFMGVDYSKSDIPSYIKAHAKELKTLIDNAAVSTTQKASKYHLQDLSDRLKKALTPKS